MQELFEESEIGRFHGHLSPVLSLSYSQEKDLLLTGGDEDSIRLFQGSSRNLLCTFQVAGLLPSPVRAVALSPDGTMAFIASRENSVKMARITNEDDARVYKFDSNLTRFEGHDHWVRAICLHWETNRLATSGNDFAVRVWNVNTATELYRFQGTARAVSVQMNDQNVYVGFQEPLIRSWSLTDENAPPIDFMGHTDWVTCLSLGKNYLLSGSNDKTARLWDLQTITQICILRQHEKSINAVCLQENEERCATGSNDGSVIYWSLENGGYPLIIIRGTFGSVRSLTFLSKQTEICFSGWDRSVRVYDLFHHQKQSVLALCAGGHSRLGKSSDIKRILNRDLLTKIKQFLLS